MKTLSGHEDVTDFALDVLGAEFGEQNIIEVTSDDVPQQDSGPSPGNRAACGHPVTLSVVAAGWLTELLHQDHVMIIGAIDACCDLGPASGMSHRQFRSSSHTQTVSSLNSLSKRSRIKKSGCSP